MEAKSASSPSSDTTRDVRATIESFKVLPSEAANGSVVDVDVRLVTISSTKRVESIRFPKSDSSGDAPVIK